VEYKGRKRFSTGSCAFRLKYLIDVPLTDGSQDALVNLELKIGNKSGIKTDHAFLSD
jgi:hypothetical protein